MSKRNWLGLSIIIDLLVVNAAIILAFYLRFLGYPPDFNFDAYTKLAAVISGTYFLSAYLSSVYSAQEVMSGRYFEPIIKSVTISWLLFGLVIWLSRSFAFPRLVFGLGWLITMILMFSWRFIASKVLTVDWPKQRILLVGLKPITRDIIIKLRSDKTWGYEVVGIVSNTTNKTELGNVPILGKKENIPSLIREHSIDRIIITEPLKAKILEKLAEMGIQDLKIEVVPDLYEILVGKVNYTTLTDIPLLELTNSNINPSYKIFKRLTDITIAVFGLFMLLPLVIIPAAILIRLTSKGPVFYRQERVGRNGNIFQMVKLRTMHQDAEKRTGPVMAKEDDIRVTKVGRFLRKYRLDEFPQLVSILKGEMSFVGPRPERPEFVEKFKREIPGYASRLSLQPGATGLAQISGSYASDAQNKLKFDLFYLYHRSYLLDIKIVLKTIKVMISGTGSH